MKITVIGRGAYGAALGKIMEENGHVVRFFDKVDGGIVDAVLDEAEAVVLAIPSEFVEGFLRDFPARFRELPLILATKGLLSPDMFSGFREFGVLSGPAFAVELNEHKPTTLTATSRLAQQLLQTAWLKIELTDDAKGVMACGTLKNIYAIEAGFRGLEPDTPAFAEYIQTALVEMKNIIQWLGGRAKTADLACGILDLVLTCGSTKSRNYQFGRQLAKNPAHLPSVTTEGLTALQSLPKNLPKPPLLSDIFQKVVNNPDAIFEQLLKANERYQDTTQNDADISRTLRTKLFREGQHPCAVIVTCADSRVVPEDIFMVGLGQLFTIRTAGNVIGEVERASIEYAVLHLGVRLVIVMGHSGCGAVGAALEHNHETSQDLSKLIGVIASHIGNATDEPTAVKRNIMAGAEAITSDASLAQLIQKHQVKIAKLYYDTQSGMIEVVA
ncbi:MAG: hypothetical protein LBQ02_00025 [Candidatus Nomurabacteria bacterium]|jgi:carbonic anhydrase|nr:hypothetical protein [Candidatus Nomurabacteria bacterium]